MKLATMGLPGQTSIGCVVGDRLVDLGPALAREGYETTSIDDLLLAGGLPAARKLEADAIARAARGEGAALADSTLAPPVLRSNLLAVAANYQDHVKETRVIEQAERDESAPWLFSKPLSALNAHDHPIRLPASLGRDIDWEGELAIIMGSTARDVRPEDALDHVAGYTIANDVSARRIEIPHRTKVRERDKFYDWLHGKWFDTFLCLGPWMVTADEIPDPGDLRLQLRVNGELQQDASTASMIFSPAELISFVSSITTLQPGDVIATGTPSGTGKASGRFLGAGDEVSITIPPIGTLTNGVVAA
jgi:2-keto-4-pentenoate hydratase/2-oxohepta-3-ene-1,7-dioic acid hydratase in catechol pathway